MENRMQEKERGTVTHEALPDRGCHIASNLSDRVSTPFHNHFQYITHVHYRASRPSQGTVNGGAVSK